MIEGSEAGGHIGPVSLTVLAQEILPHLRDVPVFVAGGIGPRRGDPGLPGDGRLRGAAGRAVRGAARSGLRIRNSRRASWVPMLATRCLRSQLDARRSGDPGARLVNQGTKKFHAAIRPRRVTNSRPGEVDKEAAQLAIEQCWAGALRRAVIDGDVEDRVGDGWPVASAWSPAEQSIADDPRRSWSARPPRALAAKRRQGR